MVMVIYPTEITLAAIREWQNERSQVIRWEYNKSKQRKYVFINSQEVDKAVESNSNRSFSTLCQHKYLLLIWGGWHCVYVCVCEFQFVRARYCL